MRQTEDGKTGETRGGVFRHIYKQYEYVFTKEEVHGGISIRRRDRYRK